MPRRRQPVAPAYRFALITGSVRVPGSRYPTTIRRGEVWHADHPVVAANPDAFSDVPPEVHPRDWDPPVEQMTAAPGELRETIRGEG